MFEKKPQEQKKVQVSKGILEEAEKKATEIKKQIAPDGKPRVITETIPEEYLKMIDEQKKVRQGLLNNMLQVSVKIAYAQKEQQKILQKIDDFDNSFRGKVEYIMKKMKLTKMQNRGWRYDGRGAFIGIYNPPKPKK